MYSQIRIADIVSPKRDLLFGEIIMSQDECFWVLFVDHFRGLVHGIWWKMFNNEIILVSIEDVEKVI